ncbi:MAG: TetR/AcrR family transcriptional regulator [Cyanobacteria bacterium P01_A01_bin.114]
MTSEPADTQTQILDAAERLFAEQGFGATSLRSIIRAADVNLAAIHYHFGSKENLVVATIRRMAKPIIESELEMLSTAAEQASLSVESILRAFFEPGLKVIYQTQGAQGLIQARLMGRCRTEPTIEPIAAKEFAVISQTFIEALQQVLPEKSEIEIKWKFDLMIAMIIRVLCAADQPDAILQGKSPEEIETAIQQLIKFAAAGMRS